MGDRTIEEMVASMETHVIYINNHLGNIDSHLDRINNHEKEQDVAITKNSTRINMIIKVGGGVLTVSATIAAITLGIMQLFR